MKKVIFIFAIALILVGKTSYAQKAEVFYFKAALGCCQARACDALENDVKTFIESSFQNGDVVFRAVHLADQNNRELVKKYNARSQTVVIVKHGREEKITNASDIVATYARNRNKPAFETAMLTKVNEALK
jgi:hypothetical protein